MLAVSTDSIQRAAAVLKNGSAALVEAVEQGKLSVSAAAAVSDLAHGEQEEALDAGEQEVLTA